MKNLIKIFLMSIMTFMMTTITTNVYSQGEEVVLSSNDDFDEDDFDLTGDENLNVTFQSGGELDYDGFQFYSDQGMNDKNFMIIYDIPLSNMENGVDYNFLSVGFGYGDDGDDFEIGNHLSEIEVHIYGGDDHQEVNIGNVDGIINNNSELKLKITGTLEMDGITFSDLKFKKIELKGEKRTVDTKENDIDISNDFKVYSYNKNIFVKTDDFNTQYDIKVYNLGGRLVLDETNSGNFQKQLSVPSGIYIINFITDKGVIQKKVSL